MNNFLDTIIAIVMGVLAFFAFLLLSSLVNKTGAAVAIIAGFIWLAYSNLSDQISDKRNKL